MPPTNITAALAIELNPLPKSITQSDIHDSGTTYTVWYKYTAQTGDKAIGFFAYGDASIYQVRIKIWTGIVGSLTAYLEYNSTSSFNDALQIYVTPGEVYFFEIIPWDATATPAVLTVVVEDAPNESVIVGDIFINSEVNGYPLTVLSSSTGAIKRFENPFPNGEYGAVLPDGYTCLEDKHEDMISVYKDISLIGSSSLVNATSHEIVVGSNRTNLFYLGNSLGSGTTNIHTMTTAGVLSGVLWNIPATAIQSLAVNLNSTILYYVELAYGSPVYAYDLIGSVPLSNLAAGITDYLPLPDMFVLADGSILVSYVRNVGTNPACVVKRYSAAGATLNTYNFNFSSTTTVRLACGIDDPISFWVKRHIAGGQATYYHILASDGSEISSFTIAEFQNGVSTYNFPLDGAVHYGCAPSCPFWLIASVVTPPANPPGMFTPVPNQRTDHNGTNETKIPNPTFRTGLLP